MLAVMDVLKVSEFRYAEYVARAPGIERKNSVFGAISTAYWLVVTALFLYLSFGPSGNGQPGTLWYIWAIAGILYGAIVAFKNVFVRKGGKR